MLVNQVSSGSDNVLSPIRRQAIIWTNAGILLIGPLGTKSSEMLFEIHTFSFKKVHLKVLFSKWRSFCPGVDELTRIELGTYLYGCFYQYHCVELLGDVLSAKHNFVNFLRINCIVNLYFNGYSCGFLWVTFIKITIEVTCIMEICIVLKMINQIQLRYIITILIYTVL